MRYLASRFVWAVTVCLVLVGPCFAQVGIRVNETARVFRFAPMATIVDLSVENQTRETISAHVLLELVDQRVWSRFMRTKTPPSFGSNEVENCFTNCICPTEES